MYLWIKLNAFLFIDQLIKIRMNNINLNFLLRIEKVFIE